MAQGKRRRGRRRQRACRACGADEWHRRRRGSGAVWVCAPCGRGRALGAAARRTVVEEMWVNAKRRATRAKVPFAITTADIAAAWPRDDRCPALAIPLRRGVRTVQDASPTLDRLNPQWGYVPGNIAVLSHRANVAKGASTADELEAVAAWMRRMSLS